MLVPLKAVGRWDMSKQIPEYLFRDAYTIQLSELHISFILLAFLNPAFIAV